MDLKRNGFVDHVREADRGILDGTALAADDQARGEAPSAGAERR